MFISYFLLLVPFLVSAVIGSLTKRDDLATFGGVLSITLLFVLFGVLHFTATELVVQMLPEWVPMRQAVVLGTGVAEIAAGIALVPIQTRRLAAWACIGMLVIFFPANVYSYISQVPVPGHATLLEFLALRTPLQFIMIGWTWWFALRKNA